MSEQPEVAKILKFEHATRAWGTSDFPFDFKQELAQNVKQLPLHQALIQGNQVANEPVTVMINSVTENNGLIQISAGIFFKGLLVGCSCSDDPGGPSETNEYCEVQVELDRETSAAKLLLVRST